MRRKFQLFIIVVIIVFTGCKKSTKTALQGTWKIIEFRMTINGKENVSTAKTLNKAGAVWNLNFLDDNKFRQNFNMSNPQMKMHTEEGTWKSAADSLFIEIAADSIKIDLNYSYLIRNDTLQLTLVAPQSGNKVISKFVRK